MVSQRLWTVLSGDRAARLPYPFKHKRFGRFNLFLIAPASVIALMVVALNPLSIVFLVNTLLSLVLMTETARQMHNVQTWSDVIGLTPPGRAGVYWMWTKRLIQSHPALVKLNWISWLFKVVSLRLLIGGVILVFIAAVLQLTTHLTSDLLTLLNVAILTVFVHLDHVYSIVTGVMVGILVPGYFWNRVLSLPFGVGAVISFQFVVYLPMLIGGSDFIYTLFVLITYFLMREIGVLVLWWLVSEKLNTDMRELRTFELQKEKA